MNQRNVEAIIKACEGLPAYYGSDFREMAEYLASRGVLGPASEVLEEKDVNDERGDCHADGVTTSHDHTVMCYDVPAFGLWLERIAKGET